jgi:hypothetical protein
VCLAARKERFLDAGCREAEEQTGGSRCERCGGDVRLLTILPRTSDHPTFRIFGCVSCSFIRWVAEAIGEP